jgi:multimeric flavodoxin WrbA
MNKRVVAIVGSYRKGGVTETAVEAILEGARAKGADTQFIRLSDHPLEFCTNCRRCTQDPGEARGTCA